MKNKISTTTHKTEFKKVSYHQSRNQINQFFSKRKEIFVLVKEKCGKTFQSEGKEKKINWKKN